MRNILLHISFIFCCIPAFVQAQQAVFIPDPAFRKYLVENHPNVMDTNQKLLPLNAADSYSPINCPGKGITNLEGIQYFTKLQYLDCSNNEIADLSVISTCTKLEQVIVTNNRLKSFPVLTGFLFLERLDLINNQLTSIPSISEFQGLRILNVSGNQLTELPKLSMNSGLVELRCTKNKLTVLPDLTGMDALRVLDCSNNSLTQLPSLANCMSLLEINCSYNRLTSLPALNHIVPLKKINCRGNHITELPRLDSLGYLEILEISNNKLISMPNLTGCLQLFTIAADSNEFRTLPNLSGLLALRYAKFSSNLIESTQFQSPSANLMMLDLSYNYLSFEDLSNSTGNPAYIYFPQRPFPLGGPIQLKEGEVQPLTLSFDQNVTENKYHWKLNGQTVEVTATGTYELKNNMSLSVEITNPSFPGKSLTTTTLLVYTNSCANDNCDEFVLSPNGDNVGDVYRIEEAGTIEIMNREGKVIKTMTGPAIWNGDDNLTGYFLVFLNGKKIAAVTLIR